MIPAPIPMKLMYWPRFATLIALGPLVAVCAAAPTLAATTALPEVLLVVDASTSMQNRLFDDLAPTCGTATDQRSRWIAAREIISGTFLSYKCATSNLPYTSEALVPPVPPIGAQKCITGLPMIVGTPVTPALLSTDVVTVNNITTSSTLTYAEGLRGALFQFPTVKVTFSALPAIAWPAGSLTMTVRSVVVAPPAATTLVLTLVDQNPTTNINKFRCLAAGPSRLVISDPVTITPMAANTAVQFNLTNAGLAALYARKSASQVNAWIAVTSSVAHYPTNCLATGAAVAPNTGNFTFFGGAFAPQPVLTVTNGTRCPSEGPKTHATASGVNDVGATVNTPFGRDGLLDIFGPSAKFALLLTDNVLNQGPTAAAGFSFGPALTSYWGTANHGMMDPFLAGTFSVPITRPDTLAARNATYAAINTALQNYVPNGPTTLGSQLDDVLQYLGPGTYMDAHFKTTAVDPVNGDPYASCRKKLVVVLSDGGSNFHDGTVDGRTIAIQTAAKLSANAVPVYVIALGHPASGANGPPAADLQFLNDLAAAGGSTKAIVQSTPGAVVKALASAIASTSIDAQANGHPESTLATGAAGDVQHSFQALSQFNISQPLRSQGIVEERVFNCTSGCKNAADPDRAQVCSVLDFGSRLLTRSVGRRLFTHKTSTRLDINKSNLLPADLGVGTVGAQPKLTLNAIGDCTTSGSYDLAIVADRNGYRDSLLDLLQSKTGSCREQVMVGAPSESQLAVLDPADRMGLREPTFQTYIKATVPTSAAYSALNPPGSAGRPTMLFAATHDGFLHAFRTDRNPLITTKDLLSAGDEMWAWLPKFTLARLSSLKLISTSAASYLGGSVTVGHIALHRYANDTDAQAAQKWRAVAVVGAGEAGAGYFALDVTAPDDPRLLWEITPDTHCWGSATVGGVTGPTCQPTTKYQHIGRSVGKPYLTTLYYKRGTELAAQHAVVVLPYGMPPSVASVVNLGVDGTGQRGAMVIELESGDLVRRFDTANLDLTNFAVTVTNPASDLGYFWADPACYNAGPGQIATRCFLGDSRGMLWRMELSDPDPTKWAMAFFHDAYGGPGAPTALVLPILSANRAPVLSPASIAAIAQTTKSTGGIAVVYGTGSGNDPSSATRLHVAYSLTETFATVGGVKRAVATRNWAKKLNGFERFIGPPLVFAFNAYWATFQTANIGSCELGTARLWGAKYDAAQFATDPEDLFGAFPNPSSPSNKSTNLDYVSAGTDKPSPVDLQPVPACRGVCNPTDVKCVAGLTGGTTPLGGPKPRYEVGVATGNATKQSANQIPLSGAKPTVGTVSQEVPQPRTAAVVTGWDLLVD